MQTTRPLVRICLFVVAIALGGLAVRNLFRPIGVDCAALARIEIGKDGPLNVAASRHHWESAYAVSDGLTRPDHLFQFPRGATAMRLEFPFAVNVNAIYLASADNSTSDFVEIRLSGGAPNSAARVVQWRGGRGASSLAAEFEATRRASRVDIRFSRPTLLSAVVIVGMWPQWAAWLYAGGLTIVLPLAAAAAVILGVLGLGTFAVGRRENPMLEVVVGLGVAASACVIWAMIPRSGQVDMVFGAFWAAAAWRGCKAATLRERGLIAAVLLGATLLVVVTEVESYSCSRGRVQPYDYLYGFYGAQRISGASAMSADLSSRPWLTAVLAAPLDRLTGRFGYWCYVGFIAGLNSLSVIVAHAILKRIQPESAAAALWWFILLPGFTNFHFMGQRLLAGMLALAAVTWLTLGPTPASQASTEVGSDRWRRGIVPALMFVLGIGLHPSAAFVVVSLSILGVLLGWIRRPKFIIALIAPSLAYFIWLLWMSHLFPDRRNDLLFYPLMRSLDEPFPATTSFLQVLGSLDSEDWRTLAVNRLQHLRQYVVAENWTPAAWTWGRWISLPNVLTWAGLALFIRPVTWQAGVRWIAAAVLAPLLFHHAFIGQSSAQFHIGPTPFLALMLLAAASLADASNASSRVVRVLQFAVLAEAFVRLAWPAVAVALRATGPADAAESLSATLTLTPSDIVFFNALSMLPASVALAIIWRVWSTQAKATP